MTRQPLWVILYCLTEKGRKEIEEIVEDFVCVEVLQPSQPNGVMSSTVNLPYHTFTGQA